VDEQLERFEDRASLLSARGKDGGLVDADISFLDLHGLDLSGLDLSGALLTGSDLRGANLEGSKLESVFAQDAEMDGACFKDVMLCYSLLQRVSLAGADFSGADLAEAKVFLCNLQAAKFIKASLVGAEMLGCDMSNSRFELSNLQGVIMRESELEGAEFNSCDLREVDFRKATLLSARFESVVVEGAIYYGKPPWDGDALDADWASILPSFDGE